MKILIVEENPEFLTDLSSKFCEEGHQVVTASDTAEALKKIYNEELDLVISSSQLSGFSGSELRNLVRLQLGKHIPIILFKFKQKVMNMAGLSTEALLESVVRYD